MRAGDRAAADVQRRADPFIDAQCFCGHGGANDIDDGIDSSDLVEMDLFDVAVVNFGFSRAQSFKDSDGPSLSGCADGRAVDDLANLL